MLKGERLRLLRARLPLLLQEPEVLLVLGEELLPGKGPLLLLLLLAFEASLPNAGLVLVRDRGLRLLEVEV